VIWSVNTFLDAYLLCSCQLTISAGTEAPNHLPESINLQNSYLHPHLYVHSENTQILVHNHTHLIAKLFHTIYFTCYIPVIYFRICPRGFLLWPSCYSPDL